MKVSKRKFAQGGYYENKTDFVLAPQDYAALGAAYDATTQKYLAAQDKAKKDADKKAVEGIQAFENRTKVMDRHNGVLQGAYDVWFDARTTAIADPTAENKEKAAQAYSQYSVIKENATSITAEYQKEVNALNKGELDATLIGNRAGALIDAQDFNKEIPFQVQNGRIMVPGADGQPVDWSQSTFYNESVFGQNGRNFIATRKAPGTDFMFAPKSDEYSQQLQGSADIFLMEGERKKGIDAVAVGSQVEQRFRSSMLSEPSAVVDAIAQEYGAFNQNVENLTVEGMLKADADFGGTELYTSKDNKFLTDWKLSFVPGEDENSPGEYKVSFMNPDEAISTGDLNPNTAAAIKNRQNALGFHIENLANQTLYKLKSQVQPDPKTSSFGSGFKKGDRLPEFRDVGLYSTPGGTAQGKSLDLAVKPVPIRFLGKSAKITNILYDPSAANNENPRDVVYGFTVESGPVKDAALTNINQELTDIKDEVSELQKDLDQPQSVESRDNARAQIQALRDRRATLNEDRANINKLSEEFTITKDILSGDSPETSLFRNLRGESGMGDVPVFDEILTSLYGQERQLMEAAQSQFTGAPSSQPAPSAGVGAKYN